MITMVMSTSPSVAGDGKNARVPGGDGNSEEGEGNPGCGAQRLSRKEIHGNVVGRVLVAVVMDPARLGTELALQEGSRPDVGKSYMDARSGDRCPRSPYEGRSASSGLSTSIE